jgi:recombination protein RecR
MLPRSIQILIDEFSKLPSVGPRQAARFVFYLLKQPKKELEDFSGALLNLRNLKKCQFCFKVIENSDICNICKSSARDKSMICIIEKDTDVEAIEKTGRYTGLYHVLGESEIKNFGKKNLEELHLVELIKRIRNNKDIKEIIIATSATTDGDTLALYISRLLKKNLPVEKRVTRLGRGLSTGSELEYMDEETLTNALLGRK